MRPGTWHPEWHRDYPYVCFIPQVVECLDPDCCSGWYYIDETTNLNGPYGSAVEARDARERYTKEFLK